MKQFILKAAVIGLTLGLSSLAMADNMDMRKPSMDGSAPPAHAQRKDSNTDDSRMNSQLLADELEVGEAFMDPELLAELDLEDLETFDSPLDDTLMMDR